jgi:hypothetical protein
MKKITIVLQCLLATTLLLSANFANAKDDSKISHVVMVWLKEPGNAEMRKQFIEASSTLNTLPGVINRHVGIVVQSDKKVVDDTFDVAVTVTLKDEKALQAYLDNPKHKQILEQKLKPIVNRVVVYDFQ